MTLQELSRSTLIQSDRFVARITLKEALWHQAIDRDYIWVVEKEVEIVGFGHFAVMDEDHGEVLGLYLAPEVLQMGMGTRLFSEFYKIASEHKLRSLQLNSTLTARKFYESLGFRQTAGDSTVEMRGVAIDCIPMSKNLQI
jgi:N-acetylglutamate synthase-like GNAT family acetyltransferase